MTKKTYHVSLIAEILVCIEVDDDCPEDAVGMIAREAVSLFPAGREDTILEIERVGVNDIVEIMRLQEPNDAG